MKSAQNFIDEYYKKNGPCCAGCDWWQWHNSRIGDCTKGAPVSGEERHSMLDIESCSIKMEAGHILTKRDHVCGDFKDEIKC